MLCARRAKVCERSGAVNSAGLNYLSLAPRSNRETGLIELAEIGAGLASIFSAKRLKTRTPQLLPVDINRSRGVLSMFQDR